MEKGKILKGFSGFYYVDIKGEEIECSLRGKYRRKKQDFLPGDEVEISIIADNKGVIEKVIPRKNQLVRPPIANIDQVIIVMAVKEPELQLTFLNRLLVLAEYKEIRPIICLNKADLLDENEQEEVKDIIRDYETIGYKVILVSAKQNLGIEEFREELQNKTTVFAGLSGAGKSSLLNKIHPGLSLKVGEVSKKIKRGRHTTRHVELMPLSTGGIVADTPGFSNLELSEIPSNYLSYCFPEIERKQVDCKFTGCRHIKEKSCAIRDALEKNEILESRYNDYMHFLEEIEETERRYK
ncbi:ribosome biogenesis GTPase [Desulfitispora alkaliphila]|uniref:ribosome small subunit-dependent GTPase A n=1 Tax=Desulfitispora alkaliphila TaxID=622674 RepID=UPI003D1BF1EF